MSYGCFYLASLTKKFIPTSSVNTTLPVTTGVRSVSPENRIKIQPLSIPNFTNKLDTDVNIDDESQYFQLL